MNRDPFGLGVLLYGLRPTYVLTAAAWTSSPLGAREFELAHAGCALTTFCKNPLHPGPCKGWKKGLGVNAPGALKAIEAARKEKLAAKRAATAEAKSAAAKGLTSRHLASPLHAKKATIKHANILLGNDEAKASGKADKVILNKTEIKKYSKIKAAHMNSVRTKHGLDEDPGLEERLAEALAKDNQGGKDDNYQAAIRGSAESLGAQLAVEHCHKGNHEKCDDQLQGALRDHLADAAEHALLTGDDEQLDKALSDWDAGKLDLTPAPPKAKIPQAAKGKLIEDANAKAKADAEAKAAADEAAKPKPKKAKAAPAPLEGTAAQADKGMKVGLGLAAFLKGNKTLGTKAQQANFAEKIKKELNGDGPNVTSKGATDLAIGLVNKPAAAKLSQPYVAVGGKEAKKALAIKAAQEIEQALKGGDEPTPTVDAFKKAIQAQYDKDWDGAKAAEKELQALGAEALGISAPDTADVQTAVNAPSVAVWTPEQEYLDHAKAVIAGKYDSLPSQTIGLAGLLKPGQFENDLTPEERQALLDKLQAAHDATPSEALKDKAKATYKKLTGDDMPNDAEPDVLQQLMDAVPEATGPNAKQQKAVKVVKNAAGNVTDAEALDAYGDLDKADFDGLSDADKAAIIQDLESIQNLVGGSEGDKAMEIQGKLLGLGSVKPATPAGKYLGGVNVPLLKEAFGDDGDPNHQEAVHLVNTMHPIQWPVLSPKEKGNAVDHINDAISNGEPGSIAAGEKLAKLGAPGVQLPGKKVTAAPVAATPSPNLTPDAQTANDYALGIKSGTATKKLTAYEKLTGEEFQALPPDTQKLVLADLKAIEAKFIAPKKKAQASDQHNYLSTFMGGGAGAGGGGNPGVNADDKLNNALDSLDDLAKYTTPPGAGPANVPGMKSAFKGMVDASGQDAAADAIAPVWADNALKKLAFLHEDPLGNSMIEQSALNDAAPALIADFAKKLKGEPGPTPHLDAFKKAITLGDEQDAATFLSGAIGLGSSSTFGGPPTLTEKQDAIENLDKLWKTAIVSDSSTTPPTPAMLNTWIDKPSAAGFGSADYAEFAKQHGNLMALVGLSNGIKQAGVTSNTDTADLMKLPEFKAVESAMSDELAKAVKNGQSSIAPNGATKQFNDIVAEVATAGDALADKNGWPYVGAAVQGFKKALLTSKVQELSAKLDTSPPAHSGGGTGGTATPPAVTTPPPFTGTPGGAPVGTGTGIGHIPLSKQQEILQDLKGLPTGKYLDDPKDVTYGNLLALAAAHGTADEPLSVMQVLQSVDNAFSKQLGVPNINKWENEFVDWLKTPDGSAFAAANPTADANLVKKFQGVYDGPSTDLAELAKKVQLYPGPGAFDASKPSADFAQLPMSAPKTSAAAEAMSKQMFAGNPWTKAQKDGVYTYTGGSYGAMNGWLRGESNTITDSLKTAIKNTQAAMRPVPKDVMVFRGTGWEQLPEGFRSHAGALKLLDKTIMDEAFLSTSVDPGSAFGGPLRLEVEVPKGAHAVYAAGKHAGGAQVSQHPTEVEMLLAAGGHYRVLSVTKVGHQTVMRLRVVDAI